MSSNRRDDTRRHLAEISPIRRTITPLKRNSTLLNAEGDANIFDRRIRGEATVCPRCAFTEAGSHAQRLLLDNDVIPTIDTLMSALLQQRLAADEEVRASRSRELALENELDKAKRELKDARDEIEELTDQVSAMTDTLARIQPMLRKASLYKKALREARSALERVDTTEIRIILDMLDSSEK